MPNIPRDCNVCTGLCVYLHVICEPGGSHWNNSLRYEYRCARTGGWEGISVLAYPGVTVHSILLDPGSEACVNVHRKL
jgi:hypothetical protein